VQQKVDVSISKLRLGYLTGHPEPTIVKQLVRTGCVRWLDRPLLVVETDLRAIITCVYHLDSWQ
jgi:hypothetical protein